MKHPVTQPAPDFLLTAAQFARARSADGKHGMSRIRAHQILARATKPPVVESVCGQATKKWWFSSLPPEEAIILRRNALKRRYASVQHLVLDPPQPWEPSVPLEKLARTGIEKAEVRRSALAPILAASDALVVPLAELVRRAQDQYGRMIEVRLPHPLALREWIERAIERDREFCRWTVLELYLDERPPVQTPARQAAAVLEEGGGDPLARALLAVQNSADPTEGERSSIWNVTFFRFASMVEQGATPAKAKRALLRQLEASGLPILAETSGARTMAWKRQYAKWEREGRCSDAFVDGRSLRTKRGQLGESATARDKRGICEFYLQTGSEIMALEMWAESAACSPALREDIQRPRKSRHNIARSLRRLIHVTPEQRAHDLGGRNYQYMSYTTRRGDFELMEDGSRRPIEPGDWWELDDMSWNQYFWFENIESDDDLARRHNVSMARQCLFCMDVKSGKWLAAELIGRSRDSYRSADILRFFHRLFALYGMPRRGIRIERGPWKSRVINGRKVEGLPPEVEEAFFGGLRKLGLRVEYCWTAKQKGLIETGFGYLQKAAAHIIPGPNIGRHRGERQRDTKQILRAQAGIVHPKDIGVLHIDTMQKYAGQAMVWCNGRQKEGRIQNGVPDEKWVQSIQRAPLRPLPPDLLYLLLPEQRPLTIRAGHVRPKVDGEEFAFSAPELFARLGTGYHVLVCFDPTETTMGAWVFNAETGSANWEGHAHGAYLGHAEFCPDSPQMAAAGYRDENIDRRKRFGRAFRVAFIATGTFGHNGATTSELRDGRGNVVRVEQGGASLSVPTDPVGGRRRRNGSSAGGDELVEKAKAMRAVDQPKRAGPDLREMHLHNQIRRLERMETGDSNGHFITSEEKAQLESLRIAYRAYQRGRGVIDVDDLKRREADARRQLGIYNNKVCNQGGEN